MINQSLNVDEIKKDLRKRGVNVVDVRKGKYLEIDVLDDPTKVTSILGSPLFITDVEHMSGNFVEFFYDMRFWECHEFLEDKWRRSKDDTERKYLQALILICASMIKYLKNDIKTSDMLIDKALSLISDLPQELLPFLYIRFCLNT
ncbi:MULTISPECIES: DUF309 domain-containing protein [Sulfolobaceae]|uniref:DUF309 domain-containing protein n=1 Tax=Sulfolobaceae TaxID=118883 RepID=UPI001E4F7E8D|nr:MULTISPECIES: DUF309 domain-containing protein [unclassified Sulfolobus]